MSSLKCPRCRNKINLDDTFCRKCGTPVKSDIISKTKMGDIEEISNKEKEENLVEISTDLVLNNKKNNNKLLLIVMLIVIVLLSFLVFYFMFVKKEKKCEKCECVPEIKYVEKEPTIQYVNYQGYRFSIPLDWSFEGKDSLYKFINKKESMYVSITSLDSITYDLFVSSDYQKMYIEKLQTENDIFISNKEEQVKDNVKYYIMNGTYDSYNYTIIVLENDNGVFIINAQFENNSVYTSKKQEVINFATSYIKNNKI